MTPVSFGRRPDVSHLRVFGCPCYPLVEKRFRVAAHHNCASEPAIFVGYCPRSTGYLCYLPHKNRIVVRMDVRFDEASMSSRPVLEGTYDVPPAALPPPTLHMSLEAPTDKHKQRGLARKQASLKTVGVSTVVPTVRVPGGVNEDLHHPLQNTCPSGRALHIQQRCAAIHGKSFMDII